MGTLPSLAPRELPDVALPSDERARDVHDAREQLHELWNALEAPARIAVSVPAVSMTGVYAAVDGVASLWLSPRGEQSVAFGERDRVVARGERRWLQLRDPTRAAFDAWPAHGSAATVPFRLQAGATFDDAEYDSVWSGFPSAWVAVPTASVVRSDGEHHLVVCASPDDSDAIRGYVDRVLDAVLAAPPVDAAEPAPVPAEVARTDAPDRAAYEAMVDAVTDAIADGDVAKVVTARRVELTFPHDVNAAGVLRRLAFAYPNCVRFAWRWQGSDLRWRTFLGATPERLVRVAGRRLESEALAGTIAADEAGDAERSLLESTKDQREHEMVVDHLRAVFGEATTALHIDEAPGLRRLRNALHLRTGVDGALRDDVDVFALLQRAHPTPAVGGLPVRAARAWIRDHEPTPRGGYAAPIGWVDGNGDAEFMVAIRSAVISGPSATLFAGAGIVADSDPAREWDETEVKLQALLEALGCG